MIEMKVAGIALDAVSRSPIILLKDASDRRALPIYISQEQAKAIVNALEKQTPPRPFTHDLIVNIFDSCNIKVDRITINSLQDNTFYASIAIETNGQIREVDARPSDAIAIAIRTKAPIWVIEEVIADASIPVDRDADEQERLAFSNFVSNLRPDDLIRKGGYAS
ncbi:bifunctional nuclease family protein [Chamaesiphon sp.]|uniref:bifunctional nuclease family protein n=1 Tax=Chamaesiphon sp. TaxID=2814140 RepID=UPI0035946D96